jgi:hypothetical protein
MAIAHSTARTTLGNSANTLSPAVSTMWPFCSLTSFVMTAQDCFSDSRVACSSSPMRRLNPTTSALKIAASLRSVTIGGTFRPVQYFRLPVQFLPASHLAGQ